jgi:hypothetical protein
MIPSETFLKWLAKAITAGRKYTKSIWAATLSTADFLLRNLGLYVKDLSRIKEANIKEIEAGADKKILEAAEIANKISLSQRNQAIKEIEQLANAQKIIAEAKKTVAETKAIGAKTEILKQVLEAKAVVNQTENRIKKTSDRLLNALIRLQEEGGEFYIDRKQLEGMIQKGLPEELDEEDIKEEEQNKSKFKVKKPRKKK